MNNLLAQWEEQFKKGQLTLWIFVALLDGEKSVEEILDFIKKLSEDNYSFDPQSAYRALRNFTKLNLVEYSSQTSTKGPEKKIYKITTEGRKLLKEFYNRNLKIFQSTKFNLLINQNEE